MSASSVPLCARRLGSVGYACATNEPHAMIITKWGVLIAKPSSSHRTPSTHRCAHSLHPVQTASVSLASLNLLPFHHSRVEAERSSSRAHCRLIDDLSAYRRPTDIDNSRIDITLRQHNRTVLNHCHLPKAGTHSMIFIRGARFFSS